MTIGQEDFTPGKLRRYIVQNHVPRLEFHAETKCREIVTKFSLGDVELNEEKSDESRIIHTNAEMTETVEEQLANFSI